MNFKCNESENFDIISKNYKELNEDLKNIINFSKEYVKILNNFKNQTSNLYSSYLFNYSKHKKRFFSKIFTGFGKLICAQIESFKTLIEGLSERNDTIEQSMKETENFNVKINDQINNSIKDIENHYSNLKKSREYFEKIGNETEDIILKYYKAKKKKEINYNQDLIINESEIINKDETLATILEKMTISENEYKKQYYIGLQYEETLLNTFQASNSSLILLCKDYAKMIYDTIIEYFIHYRSLKSLIESEINSLSNLSDLDIEEMINKKINDELVTNCPYTKSKIKPYKVKLIKMNSFVNDLNKKDEELGVQDIYNILKKFYEYLSLKDDEYDLKNEEDKLLTNNLVNKIFNFSNQLSNIPDETDDDIKKLHELLKNKDNRYIFLTKLNNLRNQSIFIFPENKFNVIGNLLYSIFDNILKDNDLVSAKIAIILSQTYYILDKNDKKIYLQNLIQHNPVLKTIEFWNTFLQYCIEYEICECVKKDHENGLINKENQEQKDKKYNNIIFTQLITISNNMIEFKVDKEDIKKVINEKIVKYRVHEDSKNIILNLIENSQ